MNNEQRDDLNRKTMIRDLASRLRTDAFVRRAELEADISALEEELSALKALKEQVSAVEDWLTQSGYRPWRSRGSSEVKAAAFLKDADVRRRQWEKGRAPRA